MGGTYILLLLLPPLPRKTCWDNKKCKLLTNVLRVDNTSYVYVKNQANWLQPSNLLTNTLVSCLIQFKATTTVQVTDTAIWASSVEAALITLAGIVTLTFIYILNGKNQDQEWVFRSLKYFIYTCIQHVYVGMKYEIAFLESCGVYYFLHGNLVPKNFYNFSWAIHRITALVAPVIKQ
jgi:hypothetical protein